MKQSTVNKYINILLAVKNSGKSLLSFCKENDMSYKSIVNTISSLKKQNDSETESIKQLLQLYSEVTNKIKDTNKVDEVEETVDTDDRAETSFIRDENSKIKFYSYQIFRRDKAPLSGKLTREEMNTIHRLYSYYGDSLTQRVISRHFVDLSLVDFKRILRAFNITKASAPFAPHMFEEMEEDELRNIQLREKENSFLRKAEEDQIKNTEKLLKKYAQENLDLKKQLSDRSELSKELLNTPIKFEESHKIVNKSGKSDLIIYLSDLHVGAFNGKYGYIQLEDYNKDEILRRLNKVIEDVSCSDYNSITVCNLGDSVDSYNKQTTRGGHELPTTISNKEQSQLYLEIMLTFFNNLSNISNNISYVCVGESNHDGDWGWINNIVLAEKIEKQFNIKSYISNNPIDKFDINDTSIIFLHGKDNYNQFKNFPLTINFKTETWFNSYFIDSNVSLKSKKCVVKGDLHQFAYTNAKHFDYISAPSLYGSSDWIAANFGKTQWGVLTMEINSNNNIKTCVIKD